MIDLSGPDRVSDRSSRYVQISGDWWQESASWTYAGNGSSAPLTNAVTRNRLKGLGGAFSADGATGLLSVETVSIDARGNQTVSRTVTDRGNKTVYQQTYTPGSSVAALSTMVNGFLVSSRSTSGLITTYAYDALGRMSAAQDARGAVHSRGYVLRAELTSKFAPNWDSSVFRLLAGLSSGFAAELPCSCRSRRRRKGRVPVVVCTTGARPWAVRT